MIALTSTMPSSPAPSVDSANSVSVVAKPLAKRGHWSRTISQSLIGLSPQLAKRAARRFEHALEPHEPGDDEDVETPAARIGGSGS